MAMWTNSHPGLVIGDPMADGVEAAELLDIEMDDLTWGLALIAESGLGGLDRREPV
jgi:hypothetical protein